MRIARFGLVGALLLGAAACQTDDGGPVLAITPPLAFVRYINAVPDTNNLTVRWVDQLDFSPQTFVNVPFRGMGQGGYQGLEAGSRHMRVFTHDPALTGNIGGAVTAQIADTTFTFVAGQYYTLFHFGFSRTGQVPAQRVLIITDALPAVNTTSVLVRAVHAGLGLPAVDLFATPLPTTALAGSPAFANVALTNGTAGISTYATVPAAQFSVQAAAAGTLVSLFGNAAPAGVPGAAAVGATAPADPIAGATIAGSVLTGVAFAPAIDGSQAQLYPTTLGTARRTAAAGIVAAGGGVFTLTDSVAVGAAGAPNYTAGFCVPTVVRYCRLNISARAADVALGTPALPAISVIVSTNGSNTVSTTANLAAYAVAGRFSYAFLAYNSAVVWFSDRQPARTTTP